MKKFISWLKTALARLKGSPHDPYDLIIQAQIAKLRDSD
jgi:hypothetical protein